MKGNPLNTIFHSVYSFIKQFFELISQLLSSRSMKDVISNSISGIEIIGRRVDVENYNNINNLSKSLNEIIVYKRTRDQEVLNIIDVGANLGFYTLAFALNHGTNVFSYEPFNESYEYLRSNVSNNNFDNVKPINIGLSDIDEKLFLGPPRYKRLKTRILKYFDRYSLGSRTIYSDVETYDEKDLSEFKLGDNEKNISKLKSVDIIKIDVEGSEIKVLNGLKETIKKSMPAIMIEINNNYDTSEIFSFLIESGYTHFLDFSSLSESDVCSELINIGSLRQTLDSEKIALDLVFFQENIR